MSDKIKTEIDEVGEPNPRGVEPAYTMGSPEPFTIHTGTDITVYKVVAGNLEKYMSDGANIDELEKINSFQGISHVIELGEDDSFPVRGTFISVVFGKSAFYQLKDEFDLLLIAKNEYGKGNRMGIGGVTITHMSSGVSIDDTSNEEQYNYKARTLIPWEVIDG